MWWFGEWDAQEKIQLWDECMKACEGHLRKAEFGQIIREVYGDIYSFLSDTYSESISSGFLWVLIEMNGSFVDSDILNYSHSMNATSDINKLRSNMDIPSTGNEEDVVLEPCEDGERICIFQHRGVADDHFYFYIRVLEGFKIQIPFYDFEVDLFTILNIAPSNCTLMVGVLWKLLRWFTRWWT